MTTSEIRDIVETIIEGSDLLAAVTGSLVRALPATADGVENITVAVKANSYAQREEAFVHVNIYVPDAYTDEMQPVEDSERVGELQALAVELFRVQYGTGWRLSLDSQETIPVEGRPEHFINNKLLFQFIKE